MKFLLCLVLCIAAAQAGRRSSGHCHLCCYSVAVFPASVNTYAAGPACNYNAPISTYAAPAIVSPFLKKK